MTRRSTAAARTLGRAARSRRRRERNDGLDLDVYAAARVLGRRGGLKGGPATRRRMSAAQRSAAARRAGLARARGARRDARGRMT